MTYHMNYVADCLGIPPKEGAIRIELENETRLVSYAPAKPESCYGEGLGGVGQGPTFSRKRPIGKKGSITEEERRYVKGALIRRFFYQFNNQGLKNEFFEGLAERAIFSYRPRRGFASETIATLIQAEKAGEFYRVEAHD